MTHEASVALKALLDGGEETVLSSWLRFHPRDDSILKLTDHLRTAVYRCLIARVSCGGSA